MLSMLAAIKAVLTRSRLVGMVMVPVVLSFFAVQVDFYSADAACFLEFSEVEFGSE